MQYNAGDRLKLTGTSDIYSTVVTDIPTESKTITFNFIACTDGEGNNYPVVQIGTQIWMAENLKTTKYLNGDLIGTTSPANKSIWGEIAPTYQWAYEGNESNVAIYGRLYTWYAIKDSRNVCPTGWHVPTGVEWNKFENYLIANGYNYDGTTTGNKIAKALASTTLWRSNTDIGTVGNTDYPAKRNATGFTALPGGYRNPIMDFWLMGDHGEWWSSSEYGSDAAVIRAYIYSWSGVGYGNQEKSFGLSVRCIKDN